MKLYVILLALIPLIEPIFAIVGKTTNPDSIRIQYGLTADIGDFPFMVSIITRKGGKKNCCFVCTGVLIKPDFVLTSARCIFKNHKAISKLMKSKPKSNSEELHIPPGSAYHPDEIFIYPNYENRPLPSGKDTVVAVKKIHFHPKWRGHAPYNLALLKTGEKITSSLKANSKIEPIPMKPSLTEKDLKGEIILAGYGVTEKNSEPPHRLLKTIAMNINSQSKCSNKFDEKRFIALKTICATHEKGNPSGVCKGDDGGPVLQWIKKKGYQLIGIISEGHLCEYVSHPQIFTLIDFKWIQSHLSGPKSEDKEDEEEGDDDKEGGDDDEKGSGDEENEKGDGKD